MAANLVENQNLSLISSTDSMLNSVVSKAQGNDNLVRNDAAVPGVK